MKHDKKKPKPIITWRPSASEIEVLVAAMTRLPEHPHPPISEGD